ncbi:flagellin [Aestuariivirga sp.]|jgi:flagellin|uniref:flagellin N-terminal helical domain-containing protein n=1 Tax=Aestuariivirga sp. TaxID=2650926 RepID=UPI003784B7ED
MTSIMTNQAAMTALQSLTNTNRTLSQTQSRISTGYRVSSAEDNAAYWSIATTMKSDRGALSTIKDALGLGAATIDVAYTGMNSAIDVTKEIKNKLIAARQPGVDRQKVQSEITELQNQLKSISDSSVFSGENWLSVDSGAATFNVTKTMIASFSRSGGEVSVGTISIDIDSVKLFDADDQSGILDTEDTTENSAEAYSVFNLDISEYTDTDNDLADLEQMIGFVDQAIGSMTTAASNLGAIKQRTKLQADFVSALMVAIDQGVGALVDADMNEESTKLQALQVQQQLGIQALSIANQNSQMVLSLFR